MQSSTIDCPTVIKWFSGTLFAAFSGRNKEVTQQETLLVTLSQRAESQMAFQFLGEIPIPAGFLAGLNRYRKPDHLIGRGLRLKYSTLHMYF